MTIKTSERPGGNVRAALALLGAVEVAPGVLQARLSTGQVVQITRPGSGSEPVAAWSTCVGCGDLMAAAPEATRCEWCEVGR